MSMYVDLMTPGELRRYEAKRALPPVLRIQLIMEADMRCHYCQRQGELTRCPDGKRWHLEHVIPLCRDGAPGRENVVVSCGACNRAKGCRTPEEAGMRPA